MSNGACKIGEQSEAAAQQVKTEWASVADSNDNGTGGFTLFQVLAISILFFLIGALLS